jgi:hypothetical protein
MLRCPRYVVCVRRWASTNCLHTSRQSIISAAFPPSLTSSSSLLTSGMLGSRTGLITPFASWRRHQFSDSTHNTISSVETTTVSSTSAPSATVPTSNISSTTSSSSSSSSSSARADDLHSRFAALNMYVPPLQLLQQYCDLPKKFSTDGRDLHEVCVNAMKVND